MSAEQKLKMAPELHEDEELEARPQRPLDIEELYDAPDPASLQPTDPYEELECDVDDDTDVRGFLPPPEAPRGLNEDLPELGRDETGFQALSTDESHVRDRMLWTPEEEESERNKVPTRGESALRDWRLKSGQKRREHAERQAAEKRTNRKSLGLGLGIGVALGLAGLGAVWALTGSETAPESSPEAITTGSPTEATVAPALVPAATPAATPAASSEAPTWSVPVVEGTLKTWTAEDHHYWQFDYASEQTLSLRWLDGAGEVALDDTACGRIDAALGRCYVGRSVERFDWLVRQGAAAGTWTVEACEGELCGPIARFEVNPS